MSKVSIIASALLLSAAAVSSAQTITPEHKARAAELVNKMTLEEKCNYLGGYRDGFHIRPVERLGIPEIGMADGPQGVRNNTKSTLFVCGIAAAATWNEDAIYEMGVALGQDARARGVHILLGPGVNMYRSPLCGRNFEYMGEDPFLASRAAVNYIKGVQSLGVMATIKHFALNNQEYSRHSVSSDADERTMNEIYFAPFRAAVREAGVGSVMTSYNLVNNVHAAENKWLITDVLKNSWGFEGIVMSDWTSTYSTLGCVKSGLDLEMSRGYYLNYRDIKPLVESGVVREKEIDAKVQTILQTLIAFGFFDRPQKDSTIAEDNPYSRDVAYRMASESAVLLKNDGVLPLKSSRRQNIVVAGPHADRIPCGGGSGTVSPIYSISLYEGLKTLGPKYPVSLVGGDYASEQNRKTIEEASAVIVAVGFDRNSEKEDSDRSFSLPEGQDELIEYMLDHNRKVIVVVYAGGGVDMSRWKDRASAIIMGWYPGQEGGLALARMLAGQFSPSGRLPVSIENKIEDNPCAQSYYSGEPHSVRGFTNKYVTYSEGVFTGYRGYDRNGTEPLWPFGYGLTYTTFSYSDLSVKEAGDGFDISFRLSNTGKYDASEVAQVYVGELQPCVPRPLKELKGFSKVSLPRGESSTVTVHLPRTSFAYYDEDIHDWRVNPGKFRIMVGSSSRDILLEAEVDVR